MTIRELRDGKAVSAEHAKALKAARDEIDAVLAQADPDDLLSGDAGGGTLTPTYLASTRPEAIRIRIVHGVRSGETR